MSICASSHTPSVTPIASYCGDSYASYTQIQLANKEMSSSPRTNPIFAVFIFPGQGAQWVGMSRELLQHSSIFFELIRHSRDILLELCTTWNMEEACASVFKLVVRHLSGEIATAFTVGRLTQRTALGVALHRGLMRAAAKLRTLPRGGYYVCRSRQERRDIGSCVAAAGISHYCVREWLKKGHSFGRCCCYQRGRQTAVR